MNEPELSPEEHEALAHWSTFGQPGERATERFVPTVAQRERMHPILSPATSSSWADVFDRAQTRLLLDGVGWKEMEDKWVVYSDDPAEDGTASVHLLRSWTSNETVRVDLEVTDAGSRVIRATWETSPERLKGGTEEFARTTFLEVCRWVLRMELAADA